MLYVHTETGTQNNTLIEKPKDTYTTSTSYTSHETPRQTHLLTQTTHSYYLDVHLYIGTIKDTATHYFPLQTVTNIHTPKKTS